jgi:hypothetical protein
MHLHTLDMFSYILLDLKGPSTFSHATPTQAPPWTPDQACLPSGGSNSERLLQVPKVWSQTRHIHKTCKRLPITIPIHNDPLQIVIYNDLITYNTHRHLCTHTPPHQACLPFPVLAQTAVAAAGSDDAITYNTRRRLFTHATHLIRSVHFFWCLSKQRVAAGSRQVDAQMSNW